MARAREVLCARWARSWDRDVGGGGDALGPGVGRIDEASVVSTPGTAMLLDASSTPALSTAFLSHATPSA